MSSQIDVFLLILRLLLIALLYLFLMQVVIAIRRDLRKTELVSVDTGVKASSVLGHLVVVDSGTNTAINPGMCFDLEAQTTIGRAPTSTIQLSDNSISAEHARLWLRDGLWHIQDVGSRNGTYVNNQPAQNALPAKAGDTVRVGSIQFKLTQ